MAVWVRCCLLLLGVMGVIAPEPARAGDAPTPADIPAVHALAMHGAPRYGPDFTHFDYVVPTAPKGGEARLSAIGTFDTLNPFTLKGVPAAGLGGTFDTLLERSDDEPFTMYGLLAESIRLPEDRAWVEFTLRPEARWHDGQPVTAEDVAWTFKTLTSEGSPFYAAYYADVTEVSAPAPNTVRFTFTPGQINPELPLIIGQLPVLPRHAWEGRDFAQTTLEPLLGSGPYKVAEVDPGRAITYQRVADYWAAGLPLKRGRHNFDRLRYDYYRDAAVALEAFKAGAYDFRQENTAKVWATGYDFPARDQGLVKLEAIEHSLPTGMQGFFYNTRRAVFADPRVRRALAYAFDFEWTNANLFHGQYTRTHSYFSNSELAAQGAPQGRELEILESFRGRVPDSVFGPALKAPDTDGPGGLRDNLKQAVDLLKEAGWAIGKDRKLRAEGGQGAPLSFEILLYNPAFERISEPFARNLERLGIEARLRVVDTAQYQARVNDYDFDMIVYSAGQSNSPGNEQRDYWSSAAAGKPGSRNVAGLADPAVDGLIDLVITAPDRAELVARTRALDRVLRAHYLCIPHWHSTQFRVAYWDKFGHPDNPPPYALPIDTWWIDPDKAARLK
ncbi:extracellular solute-binding protein [Roseospirillum parvum]|uniref:Microcin C transport system substrate-binding protein n=1 Tax=Roseospirillum parvum TaxID=83401 RepID=A0A1G7TRW2_9PROT|nr:extracellular solute-binding protein [Roseospirillum parvum]SDG38008.1 microcin C transport system substrate-binding protein [Roseospirillum parvum]